MWCACLEAPLLVALIVGLSSGTAHISVLLALLAIYHLVPLAVLFGAWLLLFGHGAPGLGPVTFWHALYWALAFIIQTAITFPIACMILRRRARRVAA